MEAQDVEAVGWDSASAESRGRGDVPRGEHRAGQKSTGAALEETEEDTGASTMIPAGNMSGSRRRALVPDSPSLSAQVPSSPSPSKQLHPRESPFGQNCEPSQAPKVGRTRYEGLS